MPGRAYLLGKHLENALWAFREASKLEAESPRLTACQAFIHKLMGNAEHAAEDAQRALQAGLRSVEERPDHWAPYADLALVYSVMDDDHSAAESRQRALDLGMSPDQERAGPTVAVQGA